MGPSTPCHSCPYAWGFFPTSLRAPLCQCSEHQSKPTPPLGSPPSLSHLSPPSSGPLPPVTWARISGWSAPHYSYLKGLQGNRTLSLLNPCCSSKAGYTGFLLSLSPLVYLAISQTGRGTCPSHSPPEPSALRASLAPSRWVSKQQRPLERGGLHSQFLPPSAH